MTPLHLDNLGRLLPSAANNQSRPPNPWIYFTQLHKSLDAQKWGSASMRIFAQWPKQSVIPLLLLGCHAQYAIHQPLATRDLPIRVRGLNSLPSRTHPSITHVGLTYPMNYPPKKYPSNLVKLRFSFCSLPIFSTFSPRFPTFSPLFPWHLRRFSLLPLGFRGELLEGLQVRFSLHELIQEWLLRLRLRLLRCWPLSPGWCLLN